MTLITKIMAGLIIGTLATGMPTVEDDAPLDETLIDGIGDAGNTCSQDTTQGHVPSKDWLQQMSRQH